MPPKADVSETRKAQIIQAALACFMRKGYANTTMDDIVAESGLSKGSLYWYFKSKDALFIATAETVIDNIVQETLGTLGQQKQTTVEKLRHGAHMLAQFTRKAQGWFSLFVEFMTQSNYRTDASPIWQNMMIEYQEMLAQIIQQGIDAGELRPINASHLALALMATYDGLGIYCLLLPDVDLEQISETLIETLLDGLVIETGPKEG